MLKKRNKLLLAVLGVIFCSAAAPVLLAQDSKPDEMVVTASRVPIPAKAVGSALSILTEEDLKSRQINLLSDALRSLPSIAVSKSGSVGSTTQIRMRGGEANHTLVLIDGIEAANPFVGEFDFGNMLTTGIERIEVLRGEQSVLWGSEAIGGVINIITKRGAGDPALEVRVEAGSFDTISVSSNLSGAVDNVHYSLTASYLDTGGTNISRFGNEDDDYDNLTLHFKGGWQPNDRFEFGLAGRYMDSAVQFDADIDFDGLLDDVDRETESTQWLGRAFANLSLFDGKWDHTLAVSVTDVRLINFADAAFDSESQGRKTKYDYQTTVYFEASSLANVKHHLTLVAEAEQEDFKNRSVFPGADQDQDTTNYAYIAEYGGAFKERLFLNAAIRRDDHGRFEDETSWSVGGAFLFPQTGTRLHARGGIGLKTPTFFEMFGFFPAFFAGNPDLVPEKSTGWDIGIEQEFWDGQVIADLTYFDSELEDEIFTDFGVFPATARNETGKSERRGVELTVDASIGDRFDLSASYTYLNAEEDGLEEIRRPKNSASLNAAYSWPEHGQVSLGVVYNGNMEDTDFGTFSRVTLDSYTLVNLSGSYQLNDQVSVFGRLENALNENYEELFGYRASGFGAFTGFRITFG